MGRYWLACVLVVTASVTSASAQKANEPSASEKLKVYAWEFTAPDLTRTDITRKVTNDFELALVQRDIFTVLERRQCSRLIAQIDIEKKIASTDDLSHATRENFKQARADIVVFGEVFDDVESGEYTVSVKLLMFDGITFMMQRASISRGKIHDLSTRQQAMIQIVNRIAGSQRGSTGRQLAMASILAGTAAITNGVVFALLSRDKVNDAQCDKDSRCPTMEGLQRINSARTAAGISYVSYGVGIVVVTAGIGLWLASPPYSNNTVRSVHVEPFIDSGAVYVFRRTGTTWAQEAYLKASNPGGEHYFGSSVALTGDTLAVGAHWEDSAATGIDGDQDNNAATSSGAVYVFH